MAAVVTLDAGGATPTKVVYDFGVSDTVTTYYIVAFNVGTGKQGVTVNTLTGS